MYLHYRSRSNGCDSYFMSCKYACNWIQTTNWNYVRNAGKQSLVSSCFTYSVEAWSLKARTNRITFHLLTDRRACLQFILILWISLFLVCIFIGGFHGLKIPFQLEFKFQAFFFAAVWVTFKTAIIWSFCYLIFVPQLM